MKLCIDCKHYVNLSTSNHPEAAMHMCGRFPPLEPSLVTGRPRNLTSAKPCDMERADTGHTCGPDGEFWTRRTEPTEVWESNNKGPEFPDIKITGLTVPVENVAFFLHGQRYKYQVPGTLRFEWTVTEPPYVATAFHKDLQGVETQLDLVIDSMSASIGGPRYLAERMPHRDTATVHLREHDLALVKS